VEETENANAADAEADTEAETTVEEVVEAAAEAAPTDNAEVSDNTEEATTSSNNDQDDSVNADADASAQVSSSSSIARNEDAAPVLPPPVQAAPTPAPAPLERNQPEPQRKIKESSDREQHDRGTERGTEREQHRERPRPIVSCFIHSQTPIPNSDSSLRILRKFISKTGKYFPTSYGGTKSSSLMSYIFGSGGSASSSGYSGLLNADDVDECCLIYKDLIDILSGNGSGNGSGSGSGNNDNIDHTGSNDSNELEQHVDEDKENEVVIESILGHSGDTMSKARQAMAAFCRLIETWSLETARLRIVDVGGDLADYEEMMRKSHFFTLRRDVQVFGSEFGNDDVVVTPSTSGSSSISPELIAIALTTAEALVAHGCFDSVMVGVGEEKNNLPLDMRIMPSITEESEEGEEDDEGQNPEKKSLYGPTFFNAVTVLAESIFTCHLNTEEVELAGLKFLLTTGCRTAPSTETGYKEAMLKGSQLLQTIRVCYRIYLSTGSKANRTTAKAALRQIVTSAFKRLEAKNQVYVNASGSKTMVEKDGSNKDIFSHVDVVESDERSKRGSDERSYSGNFTTFEHKDAYLVLRSLCKLSMKATVAGGAFDNVVVSRNESTRSLDSSSSIRNLNSDMPNHDMIIDPALDSKILALDLLVEILQGTKTDILLNAGPQLIYAVRNYLCHSLLKNCTSDHNYVVSLSLRLFVPIIRHFRSHLKTEIEAFVTNVFFVILDSKNSTVEHKLRVVILFEEICSDPATLAEIFLNYDCDLSAVDLFQRIVNTLAKVAKIGLHDQGMNSNGIFVAGAGVSRAERSRQELRELRLEAMKAVRQVLSSLHESFVSPILEKSGEEKNQDAEATDVAGAVEKNVSEQKAGQIMSSGLMSPQTFNPDSAAGTEKHSLVQIYDSKKKRREEAAKATLRFNQKPSAGIKFASEVGIINGDDPTDVAQFLLSNKDVLDKTQIGEYLGREPDYQNGFPLKVLHQYLNLLDFSGLLFDDAIKFYLSGFRLPGEAQKIDRIMEKFAERYTTQNPDIFPTADAAFILAFSIIMLNTDLHNPAIKEERRMTKEGFLRNNSGICDGKDLPPEFLTAIFDRIKTDPISLKEDDDLREKEFEGKGGNAGKGSNAGLFTNNFSEMDRKRESDYQKERDQILRSTESLLRRKKKRGSIATGSSKDLVRFVSTQDSGLKDEYVIPMFDVTWGPALAVFSTVIESANGTMGSLLSIATDREIESAAENAASATEVCLNGFRLAIRISALCGNDTARSAYVHALSNFSLLGTGRLLEHRHIRCVQTLLEVARDDGELLGSSWEYVFKALSEIARLNQVHEAAAKAFRVEAEANERRRKKLAAREAADAEGGGENQSYGDEDSSYMEPFGEDDFEIEEEMDKKAIDETNARVVHENIPEDLSDMIYIRSGSLSTAAVKDFIFQLCRVSRMEIAGYGGHVGSKANDVDLTAVHYRKQHTLLQDTAGRYNQPDIYSLQKLVEVTHYNMDSRPRLIFATIWNIVSSHLTSTSLHNNAAVAIYAVDSFRQLSLQFLQREELGVFEFQRKFLKPFEAVMSKCRNSSVKEFLLKAIEQIILMFESDEEESSTSIRSGWRPILAVIGLASKDEDDKIANLGFAMLTTQLRKSLLNKEASSSTVPIRADKFVDLVDALLMYTSGPREDKSSVSIDHLVTIARYLADESIPLPKPSANTFARDENNSLETNARSPKTPTMSRKEDSEELELWWPLLLGLSQSVGDIRPNIRIKGLVTLLAVINQHFFPSPSKKQSGVLGDIETLQLIFKGILTPALEHAETNAAINSSNISLPDGFIRFMTRGTPAPEVSKKGGRKNRIEGSDVAKGNNWIDTTFDHLMDGSISLALKSIEIYRDDILIEEVLAMFNTCLVSDSATLVIRGMKRLHHFVTSDLALEVVTENTWATVSHMLRRCLSVRGLPFDYNMKIDVSEEEKEQIIREFLQEEKILPTRRYIGSNAAMIIGTILSDKQVIQRMGKRWYLFLLSGLGAGIKVWDRAAEIFDLHPPVPTSTDDATPPQYAENALYARKWTVRLLLSQLPAGGIVSLSQTRTILKDEFENLVSVYLRKEDISISDGASPGLVLEMEHMGKMICDLLDAISGMEDSDFSELSSLTTTLSACIQINNRTIRTSVHGLLQKILQGSFVGKNVEKAGM